MSIKVKKHQKQTMEEKLNTLRAGVLGSNDGILTVVGVLVSVAAATSYRFTIFIAGLSDLLACAFSMASGEYASVSTQKDTEKAAVAKITAYHLYASGAKVIAINGINPPAAAEKREENAASQGLR